MLTLAGASRGRWIGWGSEQKKVERRNETESKALADMDGGERERNGNGQRHGYNKRGVKDMQLRSGCINGKH